MNARDIFKVHEGKSAWNWDLVEACIEECTDCAQICTGCADSCLADRGMKTLSRCIQLAQNCADISETTARVVSRLTAPSVELIKYQLLICMMACEMCAEECRGHARRFDYCGICADACDGCRTACRELLRSLEKYWTAGGPA